MKYFAIFDKIIVTIFQLQLKIGNISDMFLQYSVLCGYAPVIRSHDLQQAFIIVLGSMEEWRMNPLRSIAMRVQGGGMVEGGSDRESLVYDIQTRSRS